MKPVAEFGMQIFVWHVS